MARKDHQLDGGLPWYQRIESLYWAFLFFSLLCFTIGIVKEQELLYLVPFIIIGGVVTSLNFHWVYYLFFAVLPFSVEVLLPGGFGTDLPTEPLMLILTGVFLVKLIEHFHRLKKRIWLHPISVVLICHLVWVFFISLFSIDHFVSIKFALAKTWYVLPFYFLSLFLFREDGRQVITKVFRILWWSLFVALIYIMIRHALEGFTFASINDALKPIFRNHVNYAVLLVALLPYLVYLYSQSERKILYGLSIVFLLSAIYLSYTRAAHACVFLAIIVYFVVRFRLIKYALITAAVSAVVVISSLLHENKYLDYAPEYSNTVAHYDFDNLMEATTKLEDISTMERVYRWVAGFHMIADKPLTGFGPGCFYPIYMDYTVRLFRTYVSENPEKSGMHNAYLMIFVEQGIVGFLILLLMTAIPLIYGEHYYHLLTDPKDKGLIMAATISVACVCVVLVINELLEADKVGPLFFLSLAIITSYANRIKKS